MLVKGSDIDSVDLASGKASFLGESDLAQFAVDRRSATAMTAIRTKTGPRLRVLRQILRSSRYRRMNQTKTIFGVPNISRP